MKTTIYKPVEVEVKFLKVDATLRCMADMYYQIYKIGKEG